MNTVFDLIMVLGGLIAVLAGVGLIRFDTSYARLHAAGKATPVATLITSVGAAGRLGLAETTYLIIAAVAMVITVPVGVHLLFRAVHHTSPDLDLEVDDLARDQASSGRQRPQGRR